MAAGWLAAAGLVEFDVTGGADLVRAYHTQTAPRALAGLLKKVEVGPWASHPDPTPLLAAYCELLADVEERAPAVQGEARVARPTANQADRAQLCVCQMVGGGTARIWTRSGRVTTVLACYSEHSSGNLTN